MLGIVLPGRGAFMAGKHSSGKGGRTARMPATRFPHLQKKLRQARIPVQGKPRKFSKKLP